MADVRAVRLPEKCGAGLMSARGTIPHRLTAARCTALSFADEPDYAAIRRILSAGIARTLVFDWEARLIRLLHSYPSAPLTQRRACSPVNRARCHDVRRRHHRRAWPCLCCRNGLGWWWSSPAMVQCTWRGAQRCVRSRGLGCAVPRSKTGAAGRRLQRRAARQGVVRAVGEGVVRCLVVRRRPNHSFHGAAELYAAPW